METSFVILNLVVVAIAAAFLVGGLLTKDRKQREHAILGGFLLLGAVSLLDFTYGIDSVDHLVRPVAVVIGVVGFVFSVLGGYVSSKVAHR